MKSTIKLDGGKAVVLQPGASGTIRLDFTVMGVGVGAINITPDQWGAISFGAEMVLEKLGTERIGGQG